MTGPAPKQEGAALEELRKAQPSPLIDPIAYCILMNDKPGALFPEAAAFDLIALRSRLSEQADLIDRLKREKKVVVDMLNVQQARAQVAAQSTAKIAQELQIWLKEQASDVV